ncbi:MAG TPA: hypothetical protein VIM70_10710 [Clostridium sp.]|uniref:hypothetical protein n=1 Tax=Clostridium sp. TaxID=1506 RepID=UPI002F954767
MKLKRATFLAVIGSALFVLAQLYFLLTELGTMEYSIYIGRLLSVLNEVGYVCLLIFFIALYSNQKK